MTDQEERDLSILTPDEQELYEIGRDLKALVGTVGFQRYLDFKRKKKLEIGNRSLDDKEHSKDYWIGYRDGASDDEEALRTFLEGHRQAVEKIKAVEEEEDQVRQATISGLGGGELA